MREFLIRISLGKEKKEHLCVGVERGGGRGREKISRPPPALYFLSSSRFRSFRVLFFFKRLGQGLGRLYERTIE